MEIRLTSRYRDMRRSTTIDSDCDEVAFLALNLLYTKYAKLTLSKFLTWAEKIMWLCYIFEKNINIESF